jgi:decaprenylphospho-beta-D-erythro-pentofuranosid-2-ulose 2-reductase
VNDVTGMPQSAVVLGGSSDIGRALLRALASRRLERVLLAGRDPASLGETAAELRALGVGTVEVAPLDVTDVGRLEAFADSARARLGEIDLVLVAAGVLGAGGIDELDASAVASSLTTNLTGPAAASVAFARVLRAQGSGRLVVLSSVAGYRVRRANFVYGAAKAGLDGFALGLGDALAGSGVEVMVVRPGFVRTKMTSGRPEAPLALEPADVADAIVRGLERNASVVWVPASLRIVFGLLRLVPRALWRRLPV